MPVLTTVPFTVPTHEEHGVAVMPARNWIEPSISTTDIGGPRADRSQIEAAEPLPPPVATIDAAPPAQETTSDKDAGPLKIFFFQVQSAVLEPGASDKAKELNPKDQCYLVVGHADPTGTPRMIGPLSFERARNVAQLLREEGAKQVNEAGDGAAQPPKDAPDWPQERRAEVFASTCDSEPGS